MKRKPFYLIAILCLGFAVCSFAYADRTACISAGTSKTSGAKDVTIETRQVVKFSALKCSGSIPVTYIQSDKSEVVIEGNREFIDAYVSEVKGETLNLHMKPGNYQFLNLRVTVYSPVLDDIVMSGAVHSLTWEATSRSMTSNSQGQAAENSLSVNLPARTLKPQFLAVEA